MGPGHPLLLTLWAAEALREADAVRHHEGCETAILVHARPDADVARFHSAEEVVQLAREQRRVAVLFPGDPYAFSDGAYLADVLDRAGVEFEAVPGLLVETAAPALSGIPLTLEGRSASLVIGAPGHGDTAVLRLPSGWWEAGVASLLRHGRSPDMPAALLTEIGRQGQRRVQAPLGEVVAAAKRVSMVGDALLIVGPGVELAERLDTLARRPLHGVRVLVTRARHQVAGFARELAELGATVVEVPTIEIRPLVNGPKVVSAIERLPETSLVVFASANAVEIFFQMLLEAETDARALYRSKVCAFGPETANVLEAHGVRPDLVAGEYTAEGLAAALQGWDLRGSQVLIPRAEVARDALPQLLARRGARVEFLPVYQTVCPEPTPKALSDLLSGRWVDVITFTSSSTATNFARSLPGEQLTPALERARVACIGPVTADTARRLGMRVDIIAREYTTRGLAQAIVEALQHR
jgi:uroporphyrinogen III methyltransferase/synthase